MPGVQASVMILDEVKVLDQKVALPRSIAEQRAHLVLRPRIDLAPFREFARPPAAGTGVDAARRLRAVRFATRGMMNVHNLSVVSEFVRGVRRPSYMTLRSAGSAKRR